MKETIMNTEIGNKTESGIVLVTGSNGTIADAVMRRFAGRFTDVIGFDRKAHLKEGLYLVFDNSAKPK
jgi:nucleoside-diphosphate-sugar epimerase